MNAFLEQKSYADANSSDICFINIGQPMLPNGILHLSIGDIS